MPQPSDRLDLRLAGHAVAVTVKVVRIAAVHVHRPLDVAGTVA